MKKNIYKNPSGTKAPYYFVDDGAIEGAMHRLVTVLECFEPRDVLNDKTVIYDSEGKRITIKTANETIVDKNEYPEDYEGISYEVGSVTSEFLLRLEGLRQNDSLPDFLD